MSKKYSFCFSEITVSTRYFIDLTLVLGLLLSVLQISGGQENIIPGATKNITRNNEKNGATFASEVAQRRGLGRTDE